MSYVSDVGPPGMRRRSGKGDRDALVLPNMPTDAHPRREDSPESDRARVICDNVGAIQPTTDRAGPGATSGDAHSPRRCPDAKGSPVLRRRYPHHTGKTHRHDAIGG